jgi:hypothetical protein
MASLPSLISYMYFYAHPYPTLAGFFFASAALVQTYLLVRESGAAWPQVPALVRNAASKQIAV